VIIGIIAEDLSDVAVIRHVTAKVVPGKSFSTKHFVGNGCGKLRRKCGAWAHDLCRRGCTHIVVVHDLDTANLHELRGLLEQAVANVRADSTIVLIPVREIEAWLLTDARAIKAVFNLRKEPKLPGNPESLQDPKSALEELVWRTSAKRYVNSIHNPLLAAAAKLQSLEKCRSFAPYPKFLRAQVGGPTAARD